MDFDLIVIGAGSGGLAAAKRAASYGAKVAICEADRVGGTCVIYGCIPKKLMVYAASFGNLKQEAKGYGWSLNAHFSWEQMFKNRNRKINQLNQNHIATLNKNDIPLLTGQASFIDPNTIKIKNKAYSAHNILISIGNTAVKIDIPGKEFGITSNDFFSLEKQPKEVAIIGGGYIAAEFGSILHGLGTKVHIIIRKPSILRDFDFEMRNHLQSEMRQNGIQFHNNTEVKKIEKIGLKYKLSLTSQKTLTADLVLFATGRTPAIHSINLDEIGIKITNEAIVVDDMFRTNIPHIYSVGDCIHKEPSLSLTPVAIAEGRSFADQVFGKKDNKINYKVIPTAVFSNPELAAVGLSEREAIKKFGPSQVQSYQSTFKPLYHTLTKASHRTFLKMIVKKSTQKIIGLHMVGEDAAEIIQSLAISVQLGAKKQDFDNTMALHPTSAEEWVLM